MINEISDKIKQAGFQQYGFCELKRPLSIDLYREWLDQGHHGEMHYLERHYEMKEQPQKLLARARSAIVVALNYFPHPEPEDLAITSLKIARYARGKDYHRFFKGRLNQLCVDLGKTYEHEQFVAFSDSSPVLERDLAYRAGLGWVGKNSCLINPNQGSLFFIGEIYTSLNLTSQREVVHDFCGNCRKCIDACPTTAIQENRTLKATACISYLNIELKQSPPLELRPMIKDWLFGCDICQEVCPWNQKVFGENLGQAPVSRDEMIVDLKYLLTTSNKRLERDFAQTPLLRRGALGLKKNALIVTANLRFRELEAEVRACSENYPRLSELACWALKELARPD